MLAQHRDDEPLELLSPPRLLLWRILEPRHEGAINVEPHLVLVRMSRRLDRRSRRIVRLLRLGCSLAPTKTALWLRAWRRCFGLGHDEEDGPDFSAHIERVDAPDEPSQLGIDEAILARSLGLQREEVPTLGSLDDALASSRRGRVGGRRVWRGHFRLRNIVRHSAGRRGKSN